MFTTRLKLRSAPAIALLLSVFSGVIHAQTSETGYLNHAPLNYQVPPQPTDPMAQQLDLIEVKAAQPKESSARWLEANADARAYDAPDIIRRFDDATGEILDQQSHPILVFVLQKVIDDGSYYSGQAKSAQPRLRPYATDNSIVPCYKDHYLIDNASYPSGHAMNGYDVASVLAKVIPSKETEILERGIRYGDNRIVCGVHYPTDVEQGRLLGIAYIKALTDNKAFNSDLQCAIEEETSLHSPDKPLPQSCRALHQKAIKMMRNEEHMAH